MTNFFIQANWSDQIPNYTTVEVTAPNETAAIARMKSFGRITTDLKSRRQPRTETPTITFITSELLDYKFERI